MAGVYNGQMSKTGCFEIRHNLIATFRITHNASHDVMLSEEE